MPGTPSGQYGLPTGLPPGGLRAWPRQFVGGGSGSQVPGDAALAKTLTYAPLPGSTMFAFYGCEAANHYGDGSCYTVTQTGYAYAMADASPAPYNLYPHLYMLIGRPYGTASPGTLCTPSYQHGGWPNFGVLEMAGLQGIVLGHAFRSWPNASGTQSPTLTAFAVAPADCWTIVCYEFDSGASGSNGSLDASSSAGGWTRWTMGQGGVLVRRTRKGETPTFKMNSMNYGSNSTLDVIGIYVI